MPRRSSSIKSTSINPRDSELNRQLRIGREFMAKYRDTFRALARSNPGDQSNLQSK